MKVVLSTEERGEEAKNFRGSQSESPKKEIKTVNLCQWMSQVKMALME